MPPTAPCRDAAGRCTPTYGTPIPGRLSSITSDRCALAESSLTRRTAAPFTRSVTAAANGRTRQDRRRHHSRYCRRYLSATIPPCSCRAPAWARVSGSARRRAAIRPVVAAIRAAGRPCPTPNFCWREFCLLAGRSRIPARVSTAAHPLSWWDHPLHAPAKWRSLVPR